MGRPGCEAPWIINIVRVSSDPLPHLVFHFRDRFKGVVYQGVWAGIGSRCRLGPFMKEDSESGRKKRGRMLKRATGGSDTSALTASAQLFQHPIGNRSRY